MSETTRKARFLGKMHQVWRALMDTPWTTAGVTKIVLGLLAITFVTVGPLMCTPEYAWTDYRSWMRGLALVWPIWLATLLLRALDGYRRTTQDLGLRRGRAKRRSLSIVRALGEWSRHQSAEVPIEVVEKVRESVLHAIAFKVADIVNEKDEKKIVVSLLDFSCEQPAAVDSGKMRVVARSTRERAIPADYPREQMVAWLAIRDGRGRATHDCWKDNRFEQLERDYRSIAAVPIVRAGEAIGALSIDHPHPYRFYGVLETIMIAVQPYIGILLLTYPIRAVGFKCEFDPAHSRSR